MSCPINKDAVNQLKSFIDLCKTNPGIIHLPQFDFLKDYIESFGGKIPEPEPPKPPQDMPNEQPEEPKAPEEVDSDPESVLEFDTEGCLEPDVVDEGLEMGDAAKEITEEDSGKADELRMQATRELNENNNEKAVEIFSDAIKANPQSAILFTKRGQAHLKLKKPNACIKDCTHALELNCDSAAAYKFRGRANRLLGNWELAAKDLRQACKIDFDEQADEWLKEVQPNALKIEHHKLKQERKQLDKLEKEKQDRVRKAREAHAAKAAEEKEHVKPEPAAGAPGMGDFYKLMQDPEILAAFKDPEVAAAFEDISSNPANIMKYQANPKVQALIAKLSAKFQGGSMGGFPGFGGFPGAPPTGAPTPGVPDDGLD